MSSEGRFSVVFLILYLQATSAIWPPSPPLHMVWLLQAHLQELFALFYIMWFLMFFWDHHNQTNLPQRDSVFVHHCMELFLQRGDGKGLTCEIWDEIAKPSTSPSSSLLRWDTVRDIVMILLNHHHHLPPPKGLLWCDGIACETPFRPRHRPLPLRLTLLQPAGFGRKIGNRSERRIFSLAMSNQTSHHNVEKICWNISLKLVQLCGQKLEIWERILG